MNVAVSFGYFDGLNVGHRAIIDELKNYTYPIVVSFNSDSQSSIYSEDEKRYLLNQLGIRAIYSMPSSSFTDVRLEDFVKEVLVKKVGATVIVVGKNFDQLKELKDICKKIDVPVSVVDTVCVDEKEVTTQRVKDELVNGSFDKALELLGDDYLVIGPVIHGKAVGREHGMPTANVQYSENKMFPKYGVYGTSVEIDGKTYRGVTNIGLRPSDDNNPIPTCETLILDFNEQLYDKEIVLRAHKYVRDVIKFTNLDLLKSQIRKDIEYLYK